VKDCSVSLIERKKRDFGLEKRDSKKAECAFALLSQTNRLQERAA
jgi:hypothetical protein